MNLQSNIKTGYIRPIGMRTPLLNSKKQRFWELDFLRGICVILMVLDHLMFCIWGVLPSVNDFFGTDFLSPMYRIARQYWSWDVRNNVRLVVLFCFFFLCGISCTLARSNFRRFIPLALTACGITAVTSLLEMLISDVKIKFGVVHMLAAAVLMYAILDRAAVSVGKLFSKNKHSSVIQSALRYLPGVVGVGLLIWSFCQFVGIEKTEYGYMIVSRFSPEVSLEQKEFYSIFLQLNNYNYSNNDYFPLLPWAAVVLCGGIFGRCIYHTSFKYTFARMDGLWNKPVCAIGKYAAVIYVLHMIVIPLYLALGAWISSFF